MTVHQDVKAAVAAAMEEWTYELHLTTQQRVNMTDKGYKITWHGDLRDSIHYDTMDRTFRIRSQIPYFDEVSEREAPKPQFRTFYQDGSLTDLGEWALDEQKAGFKEAYGPKKGKYLVSPDGKFLRGFVINRDQFRGPPSNPVLAIQIIGLNSEAYKHHRQSLLQELKRIVADQLAKNGYEIER